MGLKVFSGLRRNHGYAEAVGAKPEEEALGWLLNCSLRDGSLGSLQIHCRKMNVPCLNEMKYLGIWKRESKRNGHWSPSTCNRDLTGQSVPYSSSCKQGAKGCKAYVLSCLLGWVFFGMENLQWASKPRTHKNLQVCAVYLH